MTYKPISLHRFMAVIIMAATMCCVACRHDDDNSDDGIVPTEVADAPFYLQLSVSVDNGGQTRGGDNPWGGESGDGNYVGSTDEKQINNAILLLYKTTNSANININADEIKVLDAVVFPEFEPIGSNWIAKTPQKVNPSLIDNEFHAIVITNIDPNNNKIYTLAASMKGQPLSTVRDMAIDSHPWFLQGPSLYSWFAMCSKNDDVIRFVTGGDNFQGGSGTETNPYIIGNIVVERLAARIDISPSPAANASNPGWNSVYKSNYNSTGLSGYLFRVDDGETTSSTDSDYDHFLLTGVDVANIPNEDFGTYFIRRTLYYDTEDKPQLEYFGQDASGTTSTKWTLTRWTSKIRDDLFAASYASKYETKSNITLPADLTSSKKYFTAAYAVENTFLSRNASGSVYYTKDELTRYATKIIFKGKYFKKNNTSTDKTYEYVIRHSDPSGEGDITSPMLYGIVRNNIYRVAINKIVGSDITMISAVVWYYGSGTDGSIEHLTEKTVNLDKYIGDKESAEDNGLTGGYPNDAPARRE